MYLYVKVFCGFKYSILSNGLQLLNQFVGFGFTASPLLVIFQRCSKFMFEIALREITLFAD